MNKVTCKNVMLFAVCLALFPLSAKTKEDLINENKYIKEQINLIENQKFYTEEDKKVQKDKLIDLKVQYNINNKEIEENGKESGKTVVGNETYEQEKIKQSIELEEKEKQKAANKTIELINQSLKEISELERLRKENQELMSNGEYISGKNIMTNPFYINSKKIDELGMSITERQKIINQHVDELAYSYTNLAILSREAEQIGDPVDVTTGNYIAEYCDFVGEDFLHSFKVNRFYNFNNYTESFGTNWGSSLDARIIRCHGMIDKNAVSTNSRILSIYKNIKSKCESFKSKYGKYSNGIESKYDMACSNIKLYEDKLEKIKKQNEIYERIKEKNKYVNYGKYREQDASYGSTDVIIYIDENGLEHYFVYDKGGNWLESNNFSKYLCLKSLNRNGDYSLSENCDGGYELQYKSGEKIKFSGYGIIEDFIDKNTNVTQFINHNGLIDKIILKTGENIAIVRDSNNFITSIGGPISGYAKFKYAGKELIEVTDNKGIKVQFGYDETNKLVKIVKADNSYIQIQYEYNKFLKKDVCISVIDENGSREEFQYDFENKIVYHKNQNLGNEYYKIGKDGNTYEYKDSCNNIIEIKRNDYGQISHYIKNNLSKRYIYNNEGLVESIIFPNGNIETFKYNDKNQLVEVRDSDGFSNSYVYDYAGNLISSYMGNRCCGEYVYYQNGLLKEYTENNIKTSLKYNTSGKIIEKNIQTPSGKSAYYKWEYDNKNRVIKYYSSLGDDYSYSYDYLTEIITGNGKEIVRKYNERKWLIKEIVKEIKTGKTAIKENVYDKRGRIIKVFTNNELVTEYEYLPSGILKSFTLWNCPNNKEYLQGVNIEYEYNDKWNLVAENRKWVACNPKNREEKLEYKNYKYKNNGKNKEVIIQEYNKPINIFTYNEAGRLIKEEIGSDYFIIYNYSNAGRLIQQRDSNNKIQNYIYDKNGGVKVIYENGKGGILTHYYNQFNQLIKIQNNVGLQCNFYYDDFGNLLKKECLNFISECKYDNKNRIISYCAKTGSGKIVSSCNVVYDDINLEKKVCVNNQILAYEKVDIWNRVIEENSSKGHFYYDYDGLGNCISVSDFYGNRQDNYFSPLGTLIRINYDNGDEKNYEYDLASNLIKICNKNRTVIEYDYDESSRTELFLGSANKVFFDENKIPEKIQKYDTGTTILEKRENCIVHKDNYDNEYKYFYDSHGRIIAEENPLGETKKYVFNDYGELKQIINQSGNVISYNYDKENSTKIIEYDSGEKIEISENIFGKPTRLKTNDYSLLFEYDVKGNLISEKSERTNSVINFKYDNFNRCIEKSGNNFRFGYSYDEMSRIRRVENENTGQWISFEYDRKSRIIKKLYSNGCESNYSYNDLGQMEYMISKNQFGALINCDFIVYDDYSRIVLIANEQGKITRYKYDEGGRLKSTIYPYTENNEKFFLAEAVECGYYVDGRAKTRDFDFEAGEKEKLNQLINKSGVSYNIINFNQENYWFEEYEYDKNGNIILVENPLGKIIYKYDKLNRIIAKNYNNTESEGIHIKWDKNNCLTEYNSKIRKITFEYGELLRPVKIVQENKQNGEVCITEYGYDSIGRRVLEKSGEEYLEYLYDGLSTNLISKQYITSTDYVLNAFRNSDNKIGKAKVINQNHNKEYDNYSEYRTVDNSKYKAFGSELYSENETNQQEKDKRAFNILGVGSTAFIISFVDGAGEFNCEDNFPITNYTNEIIGIVNKNGDLVNKVTFDTWGNILIDGVDSLYTGAKSKDINYDFIFNLGNRDYIPLIKSFTTEDPIRAGFNWFSYCACDPINYEDSLGLKKQSLTDSENYKFSSEMTSYMKFNSFEYNSAVSNKETYMNLDAKFDCADTSAIINYDSYVKAGIDNKMPWELKEMGHHLEKGDIESAKNMYSSERIRQGIGVNKMMEGYDRDFLLNHKDDRNPNEKVLDERKKRETFINKLKEPNNICPGTTFVWGNSEEPRANSPSECGHSSTVLEVQTNENGIPIGFLCFEGHIDGSHELTYISIETREGVYSIDDYMGDFDGVVEIEGDLGPEMRGRCGK